MNLTLKKEIINHILKTIGLIDDKLSYIGMFEKLNSDQFLIDKKIIFELDGSKIEKQVWATNCKIDENYINIIIADISDDSKEYAFIIQMDNMIPYAIRLSDDPEDFGTMLIYAENNWIEASTMLQAKMLLCIQSLSELYMKWERIDNYKEIYKLLINFLNFQEQE